MKVASAVRLKSFPIICRAVEEGVIIGWNRHKHTDEPEPGDVREQIESAVMAELCEVVDFDE